jgi:hypothetical protein
MKKLLVVMFSLSLTLSLTAQPKIGGGFRGGNVREGIRGGGVYMNKGTRYIRPQVTVIAPYASMYPYYGYGLGPRLGVGYSPFYDPFYNSRMQPYQSRPTQLDLQIEDIENEYDYKISSAKDDKSLSKDERKQKIRDLKHERDQEVIDAKKSYYSAKDDDKEAE